MAIAYNKLSLVSDWADPDFRAVAEQVYGVMPDVYRKHWEVTQAARALLDFGAVHSQARILGVGAGKEYTSFWLTGHVQQVFATDLYYQGGWPDWADPDMLVDPSPHAPCAYNRQRLVVQHMDGRALQYPDAFFDGLYSSSSIEHFGTLDEIAQAAREMGRVLKPGGVLSLTTEFKISGPGDGWGNVVVFNADTLRQYVIEPSGCVLVDVPDYAIDAETRATEQDLNWVIAIQKQGQITPTPHVVLRYGEYVFASFSLTMVKP